MQMAYGHRNDSVDPKQLEDHTRKAYSRTQLVDPTMLEYAIQ